MMRAPESNPHLPNTPPIDLHIRTEAEWLNLTRQDVETLPFDKDLVMSAFYAARGIGDKQLAALDPSGGVQQLLENTKMASLPVFVEVADSLPDKGGSYGANGRQLKVSREHINIRAEKIAARAEQAGLNLQTEQESQVLALLEFTAHEGAHALLGGISVALGRAKDELPARLGATGAYLSKHPEKGVTGHWGTDLYTQEERFAEGYTRLTMQGVLEAGGYDKKAINRFLKTSAALDQQITHRSKHEQLDHLHKTMPEAGPHSFIEGPETHAHYPGALGYDMPLTDKELGDTLKELVGILNQPGEDIELAPDPHTWFKQVQANQSLSLRTALHNARRERLWAKNPEAARKRELPSNIRRVAAIAMLGFVFFPFETPSSPAEPHNLRPEHSVTLENTPIPDLQVVAPETTPADQHTQPHHKPSK